MTATGLEPRILVKHNRIQATCQILKKKIIDVIHH